MNWKLITVILISLILLVLCYLTLVSPFVLQKYFVRKNEEKEYIHNVNININIAAKKIKVHISKEDFKLLKIPEGYVAYYFGNDCPDYKQGFFLVDISEEGLEKYHVPEKNYLILVKKEHRWEKEPDFEYLVSE